MFKLMLMMLIMFPGRSIRLPWRYKTVGYTFEISRIHSYSVIYGKSRLFTAMLIRPGLVLMMFLIMILILVLSDVEIRKCR